MAQQQQDWFTANAPQGLKDWFAENQPKKPKDTSDQGPPSPSVMDERGLLDRAVDTLPTIGGVVGGWLSRMKGTPVGAVTSGLGAATGELTRQGIRLIQGRGDQVPDTLPDALRRARNVGLMNAASEVGGRAVIGGLSKIAPKAMHWAFGSQSEVRKAFPDVNLENVALREGYVPGSRRAFQKLQDEGARHATTVRATLKADDIARGNAPVVTYDDAVSEFRKAVPDARAAAGVGRPEGMQAVREVIRDLRPLKQQPVGADQAFVGKQAWQQVAKPEYGAKIGAHGPAKSEMASTVARGLNQKLKAVSGTHAEQIQRAQELIALERAGENTLARTPTLQHLIMASSLAGGAGNEAFGSGDNRATTALLTPAIYMAMTNPRALGSTGLAAQWASRVMRGPAGRVPDAVLRQSLLQLLMNNGSVPPETP